MSEKGAKIGFYIHFTVFITVNIALFSVWFLTMGPAGFPWFLFPLIGMGIGVTAHGLAVSYENRKYPSH